MRAIRTALFSLAILTSVGVPGFGQNTRRFDIAAEYMAQHADRANTSQSFTLQGGSLEAAMGLRNGVGIAATFSGTHAGSIGQAAVPLSLVVFSAGPRYRYVRGRFSPYGEALFGYARGFDSTFPSGNSAAPSAGSAAVQLDAGLDIAVKYHMRVRALDIGWLHTAMPNGTNNVQNNLSIGAGVVFSFGR